MENVLKYPQLDTTYMQVEKGSEHRVTLNKNSLEVFSWSNNKYLDKETQLWEDKFFYNKATVPKAAIIEIDIHFSNTEKVYQVQIKPSDNFLIAFKTKEEANGLYNKLVEWLNL
jgi:hypothetical protein